MTDTVPATKPNTDAKHEALSQIATLARDHDITLDEIGAHLTQERLHSKDSSWLTRLFGYLGAVFIFGGLGLYVSMIWGDLGSMARVIITYGPGMVAFVLGIIMMHDERFHRASTPLFLKAAVLLPVGMFVFLDEYADGDDAQLAAMIVFGILCAQFMITFFFYRRTSLLFFGYLYWNSFLGLLMDRNGVDEDTLGIGLSLSILLVAYGIDKTQHRAISAFWYFMGGVGLLWSVFQLVEDSSSDILLLPLSIGLMWVSVRMHSRTLLIVGTFGLFGFLTYYTDKYFQDIVGWPIALIVLGFVLIGISYFAVNLGQRIKADTQTS